MLEVLGDHSHLRRLSKLKNSWDGKARFAEIAGMKDLYHRLALFRPPALVAAGVLLGCALGWAAPQEGTLNSSVERLARELMEKKHPDATGYEIFQDKGYLVLVIRFGHARVQEPGFPDVYLYLYDIEKGQGLAHAGKAISLYGDHLLRDSPRLFSDWILSDLEEVAGYAADSVNYCEPRVEQAFVLRVGLELGTLAASIGKLTTVERTILEAFKAGVRYETLRIARQDVEVSYESLLQAVGAEHDNNAVVVREVNWVLRNHAQYIGAFRKGMTIGELYVAFQDSGKPIEALKSLLEFREQMPLDAEVTATVRDSLDAAKILRVKTLLTSVAWESFRILGDEVNFEKLAQFLMLAWKHGLTAQYDVAAAKQRLSEWRDNSLSRSVDSLQEVCLQGAFACRNEELALMIQAAAVELDQSGWLGAVRAFFYEHFMARPGAIEQGLAGLADKISTVRDRGVALRSMEKGFLAMVHDSLDGLEPLPLRASSLHISSVPPGAAAFVNGQRISGQTTPLSILCPTEWEPGRTLRVAVELAGFQRAEQSVAVVANEVNRVDFVLQPTDTGGGSLPRDWLLNFLAAILGVVVGSARQRLLMVVLGGRGGRSLWLGLCLLVSLLFLTALWITHSQRAMWESVLRFMLSNLAVVLVLAVFVLGFSFILRPVLRRSTRRPVRSATALIVGILVLPALLGSRPALFALGLGLAISFSLWYALGLTGVASAIVLLGSQRGPPSRSRG
jgi:hypothetical protein